MKSKSILFAFTAILLIGCVQPKPQEVQEEKKIPIVELVSSFMKEHPNYLNNDVTKEEGDKAFEEAFMDTTKNYFQGVPAKLALITKNGNSYLAQFHCWITPNNFKYQKPVHEVNCDIVTLVSDSLVDKLVEGEYYLLKGFVIERFKTFDVMEAVLGKSTTGITDVFGLRKNDIYDDQYDVNLGYLFYHLDGIDKYNPL